MRRVRVKLKQVGKLWIGVNLSDNKPVLTNDKKHVWAFKGPCAATKTLNNNGYVVISG